jgi:hypothetical protein
MSSARSPRAPASRSISTTSSVRSLALPRFWRQYRALPAEVRAQARKAYARFARDPAHPSLRFKELQGYPHYWSVRVTLSYRAIGKRDGDVIHWFWIGSHADFDRDFG